MRDVIILIGDSWISYIGTAELFLHLLVPCNTKSPINAQWERPENEICIMPFEMKFIVLNSHFQPGFSMKNKVQPMIKFAGLCQFKSPLFKFYYLVFFSIASPLYLDKVLTRES